MPSVVLWLLSAINLSVSMKTKTKLIIAMAGKMVAKGAYRFPGVPSLKSPKNMKMNPINAEYVKFDSEP